MTERAMPHVKPIRNLRYERADPMRYPPINARFPHLWHGGDYNPDQWLATPEIIEEDFRLMKLAHINSASVAIFAWAALEPEEGRFTFDWLDDIMERAARQGMAIVLATPSGAKPNWLAAKYPEVRRCTADGQREPQRGRHNHCYTSPVYREKVAIINRKLAERYRDHPALAAWHISNEYGGACYCPLCKAAFRTWLKRKYGTLDALNAAWWTAFWSHTFTDWEQIDWIDETVNGLALDWRRFVTDQTTDFMRWEIAALKAVTPDIPATTNLMGFFEPLDYWKLAPHLDVISWDNYPAYHDRPDQLRLAARVSMVHDLNRSLKGGRPFMLMESAPGPTNWMPINRLLRPGVHYLKSFQAVAHGADTVQYFQFRKGRGGAEKFHAAVVDHVGHEHTRMFAEVARVGADLQKLDCLVGAAFPAAVGLIVDWENWWALKGSQGPSAVAKNYLDWCLSHYIPFWNRGIGVDVINMDQDFDRYRLVIAPSLYLLRPGVAERLAAFVAAGGTLVTTYLTGIADENDRVFLGGWPGPLKDVLGVWAEEIDYLYEDERNRLVMLPNNALGLEGTYAVSDICDVIHAQGATVLATYGADFYAGQPALTVQRFGRGAAYYLAAKAEPAFLDAFYGRLAADLPRALATDLPAGVTAQRRTDGARDYIFLMNFTADPTVVALDAAAYQDLLSGEAVAEQVALGPYGVRMLARPAGGDQAR